MTGESTVKDKKTNPRRAKTPAGVWLIVALTLFFGLGGFGIAAFIVVRALRAGKGAGTAEVQPARSPAVTTPVPATAVLSSPSVSAAVQQQQRRPTESPNPSPAAQETSDLNSPAPPDPSPAEPVVPEPTPTLAVAIVPDSGANPDLNGNPSTPTPDKAAAAAVPRGMGSDDTPAILQKDPAEERRVRQEVLVRIDLLKELTQSEKDHLYSQVERARGFTKLAIVPFPSGRVVPENKQVEHLVSYLRQPSFQKLFEDPTVVLVCAGYADRKGSEAQNLEISHRRAENMVRILQGQTRIRNLMRAVGMGGSDLFDKTDAAKNRVVEIWLVQP